MTDCDYVLISAVRNEAAYIEGVIDTVVAQTIKPSRWIIVDDGSTDDTYRLAIARASGWDLVKVVKADGARDRDFASKVFALQTGFRQLSKKEFAFVGFLDADIRLSSDYYQKILQRFDADDQLGIAGGMVVEEGKRSSRRFRLRSLSHHVAGGVQLFRRQCYEQVGGYLPIATGGEDTVAEITAAKAGWKVRTFDDIPVLHLRGADKTGIHCFVRSVRWGERFYAIGYHPVYFLANSLARIMEKPPIIGTILHTLGFFKGYVSRQPKVVSSEFTRYLRKEQRVRLRRALGIPYLCSAKTVDAVPESNAGSAKAPIDKTHGP